jgi:putative transposase
MSWIDRGDGVPLARQCALAGVARASVYRQAGEPVLSDENLLYCRLIDEEYTRHPFYGTRRMTVFLRNQGYAVNRKRVQRLMQILGLQGMAPGPATSQPHPGHKVYPYLLRGLVITRPNQVWSTDITFIRLPRGFMYLVAIMDWYSRKVLSWRLSNTMESAFCVDCLEDALALYGTPEIFNSDQGSQFTSAAFTGALEARGIQISMDGRGRALDNVFVERLWRNVKHEDVYLNGYATVGDLTVGLAKYFALYNGERPHQGLANRIPDAVYTSGSGGGAQVVDKWPLRGNSSMSIYEPLKGEYNALAVQAGEPMTVAVERGGLGSATNSSQPLKPGQRCSAADVVPSTA